MTDIKRRKFVTYLSAGAAIVPLSALITSLPSHAADAPAVDPTSAQAKALQYAAVSEVEGQICKDCALYSPKKGTTTGACPLFPGSSVPAEAHCSAFVAKG